MPQEIFDHDIMTLIYTTEKVINLEVSPLRWRVQGFSDEIDSEYSRLDSEEALLRRALQYLAVDISGNAADVSICLDIALEDADRIFANRSKYNSYYSFTLVIAVRFPV